MMPGCGHGCSTTQPATAAVNAAATATLWLRTKGAISSNPAATNNGSQSTGCR